MFRSGCLQVGCLPALLPQSITKQESLTLSASSKNITKQNYGSIELTNRLRIGVTHGMGELKPFLSRHKAEDLFSKINFVKSI